MRYLLSDTSIIQITETSGTIQNCSSTPVELSTDSNFNEKFILLGNVKTSFRGRLYIRVYGQLDQPIEINVVTFITEGGTASSSDDFDEQLDSIFSGETVPDESVASDDEMNDALDDIFSGNGTATIDVDDDFNQSMDSIFGGN